MYVYATSFQNSIIKRYREITEHGTPIHTHFDCWCSNKEGKVPLASKHFVITV